MDAQTTIVGVATGTPDGGVAIVRLSGARAQGIARELCGAALPRARRVGLRQVCGREQALVVVMPAPRSFTGEDVVELQIHAGARNVAQVVEAALSAGAAAAGPGEFTRRAFDNRRLSLDEAEGIAALIAAQTDAALEQARRLVAGELGREVEALRARVELLRVEIEANLDFPEDVAAQDERRFLATAQQLGARVERWLAGFERGRRARARARVVIAGPPNAGKSALFNALLERERALVSPTAGTTRDYVEAGLRVGAREINLIDTAGLRESEDEIERAGVVLGREQLAGADLVLWVEGAEQPRAAQAELDALAVPIIEVENKCDLAAGQRGWLQLSAASGAGLEQLREAIAQALTIEGEQWIGLARHRDRAREALEALEEAQAQLRDGLGLELVALSLAIAWRALGEIRGRTDLGPVGESVLGAIFSRFCIGK